MIIILSFHCSIYPERRATKKEFHHVKKPAHDYIAPATFSSLTVVRRERFCDVFFLVCEYRYWISILLDLSIVFLDLLVFVVLLDILWFWSSDYIIVIPFWYIIACFKAIHLDLFIAPTNLESVSTWDFINLKFDLWHLTYQPPLNPATWIDYYLFTFDCHQLSVLFLATPKTSSQRHVYL